MSILTSFLACALSVLAATGVAQVGVNLVPNPSFEEYVECPVGLCIQTWDNSPDFQGCTFAPVGWYNPTYASPDYFHVCSENNDTSVPINSLGVQSPSSGYGYVGMISHCCFDSITYLPTNVCDTEHQYREYLQCKLNTPLIVGKEYILSYKLSLADSSTYAINSFRVHLSEYELTYPSETATILFNNDEQSYDDVFADTSSWMFIQRKFTADKSYQFLTIGNFLALNNNSYIFSQVGSYPLVDYKMYLAYYYIDDIALSEIDGGSEAYFVPNILTPNNDGINDVLKPTEISEYEIIVFDRWGKRQFQGKNEPWNPTNDVPAGVYYYEIRLTFSGSSQQIRTGHCSVLR